MSEMSPVGSEEVQYISEGPRRPPACAGLGVCAQERPGRVQISSL